MYAHTHIYIHIHGISYLDSYQKIGSNKSKDEGNMGISGGKQKKKENQPKKEKELVELKIWNSARKQRRGSEC